MPKNNFAIFELGQTLMGFVKLYSLYYLKIEDGCHAHVLAE